METAAVVAAGEGNGAQAPAVSAKAETPRYLLPQMEGTPVAEPAIYRSLFILDTIDRYLAEAGTSESDQRNPTNPQGANPSSGHHGAKSPPAPGSLPLDGPIDPFDDAMLGAETQRHPAVGVLTVHRQGWEQSGLALGNLLQSVCLAPGEVTRVAVIDWRRQEAGRASDVTEQGEMVSAQTDQQRAVNEVQKAVASEAQSGGSSSFATSSSSQAAATISSLFANANASAAFTATGALTAQFSAGSRDLGVTSTNAISQRTAEKSQALRSRRQSVVREVSQEESEQLSTRILANYNRRHTLNIEYFEVLQLYRVKTTLVGWERCLFVPLKPLDFSAPSVLRRHRADLLAIITQLGATDLADRLARALDGADIAKEVRAGELERLRADRKRLERAMSTIRAFHANRDRAIALARTTEYAETAERYGLPTPDDLIEKIGPRDRGQWVVKAAEAIKRLDKEVEAIIAACLPVDEIFDTGRIFLSQLIWLRMDAYRVYRALEPYQINGKPLSRLVDPHPVGVFGNYLAFRWGFAYDEDADRRKFEELYLKQADTTVEEPTIGLPTSGVFAEAVLGRGEAAEEIDEQRFGKWLDNQPPLLPPDIDKIRSRDRAKEMDLSAQDFAAALAKLRATNLEDVSHLGAILGELGKGKMFRDMGGLAQGISLAEKVSAISGEGATSAGARAVELQGKILATFEKVLESDVGKAAVAEFMLPGAGALLLSPDAAGKIGDGKPAASENSEEPRSQGKKDGDKKPEKSDKK